MILKRLINALFILFLSIFTSNYIYATSNFVIDQNNEYTFNTENPYTLEQLLQMH